VLLHDVFIVCHLQLNLKRIFGLFFRRIYLKN